MHISNLKLSMSLKATKGRKTEIQTIYPRHFLATAKGVGFAQQQMLEILRYFADNLPRAVDAVRASLPGDFSPTVYQAIISHTLRNHALLQSGLAG